VRAGTASWLRAAGVDAAMLVKGRPN
jgi:hypothetical protein